MSDELLPRRPSNRALTLLIVGALFVATVAGAGVLAVGAASSAQEDGDSVSDSRENAMSVQMNTSTNGTIDGPNDTDWYAVEVEDKRTLLATLFAFKDRSTTDDGDSGSEETTDISVAIYGPDGERIDGDETRILSGDRRVAASTNVEDSDTYFVKVSSEYGDEHPHLEEANGSQRYSIEIDSVYWDQYEPNDYDPAYPEGESNNRSNVANISSGERVLAHTTGLDEDSYAIEVEEGETVSLEYNDLGTVNPWTTYGINHTVQVFDPDGNKTAEGTSVTFEAAKSGTYIVFIQVEGEYDANRIQESTVGLYDLTVTVGSASTPTPTATPSPTPTPTPEPTDTPSPTPTDEGDDDTETAEPTATDEHKTTTKCDL